MHVLSPWFSNGNSLMTDAQPEGSLLTVQNSRWDAPSRARLSERVSGRAGALTVGLGEVCILQIVRLLKSGN
jgi:hypothetical protein